MHAGLVVSSSRESATNGCASIDASQAPTQAAHADNAAKAGQCQLSSFLMDCTGGEAPHTAQAEAGPQAGDHHQLADLGALPVCELPLHPLAPAGERADPVQVQATLLLGSSAVQLLPVRLLVCQPCHVPKGSLAPSSSAERSSHSSNPIYAATNGWYPLQVLASNVVAIAWNTYLSKASHNHVPEGLAG